MKFKFLLLLFVFTFLSCKQHIAEPPEGIDFYFEKTQPVNDSELSQIPNKFLGSYFISDDFYLKISKDHISTKNLFKSRIHKSDFDSLKNAFILEKDRMIFKEDEKLIYSYKYIGDSIELSNTVDDTIFSFSERQKMKRVGNCLVLNQKDSVFWEIKIIRFDKKTAAIEYLYDWDQLHHFDSLTKIKSKRIDSTKFILSPSRREFKKYLQISRQSPFHQFNKAS
jgi:hypothetical protein